MRKRTIGGWSAAALLLVVGCLANGVKQNAGTKANAIEIAAYGLETGRLVEPRNVVKPTFSWKIKSDVQNVKQTAYRLSVRETASGLEVWNSGEIAGDTTFGVPYAGAPMKSGRRYTWQVESKTNVGGWMKPAASWFETGLLERDAWANAKFIMAADKAADEQSTAMSVLKTIGNAKAVTNVYWFTTGQGVYEAYVNGKVASEDILQPGFTHYAKCRSYFGADITSLVKLGAGETNAYSATVTDGWWSDQITGKRGKRNAFAGILIYRYADGTEERFATDGTWLAAYGKSECTKADIFWGERIDAGIDTTWRVSGDAKGFAPAAINTEFHGEIRPLKGSPVRMRRDLTREKVSHYAYSEIKGADTNNFGSVVKKDPFALILQPNQTLVVDFGQNLAGVPEVSLIAPKGTTITIDVAEMLNDKNGAKNRKCDGPEGSLYHANYRGARTRIDYICKGGHETVETILPKHTFFGFRYIALKASNKVTYKTFRAIPCTSVNASMEGPNALVTDHAGVNQLVSNAFWGMYSNYLSVPTDCPQRDERLGWAADTQVFSQTGCYLADVYGLLHKWCDDMRDSQHSDGGYPSVAPLAQYGDNGGALGWSDAGIIVPHVLWRMYGDKTVLADHWDAMEKYMGYIVKHHGPNPDPWGEWLAYERNDRPIRQYLSAAFGVWDAMMMQDMAKALGNADAAKRYAAFEQEQRAFFAANYLNAAGEVRSNYVCQAAYIYAIDLDLVKGAAYTNTVAALKANIEKRGNKLGTGFLGTARIQQALTKAGLDDVAYTLLLQRGEPSWLFSVDQGATSYWERWNSYSKQWGFGNAGMNSFNHYAYGAVVAWMYESMAGIREDKHTPGFRHFFLAPHPDKRVSMVNASYESAAGRIESAYHFGPDGGWTWTFTIPANTTATVIVPGEQPREYGSGTYSRKVGIVNTPSWITADVTFDRTKPAPYYIKNITLDAKPKTAAVKLAVAGWIELYVNGQRIGDEVLYPATTQPNRRLSEVTFDVSAALHEGENEIRALLGNGWWYCATEGAWGFEHASWHWNDKRMACPMICGSVVVDGQTVAITDESWIAADSPIVFNQLRNGEYYDGRLEGKDRNRRLAICQARVPTKTTSPNDAPPCRVFESYDPVEHWTVKDRNGNVSTLYDFKHNIAGWCDIEVVGEAGSKVAIDYDESTHGKRGDLMGRMGNFNRNPKWAFQHDEYTLAGRPEGEKFHPRFTYHGFRYARVKTSGKVTLKSIRQRVVHSAIPQIGTLETSDADFMRFQNAVVRSYYANFVGIPTDCPHREKNGWTGDAQLACETGLWNFDAKRGYEHFVNMMLDAQAENGKVPCILPCTDRFGYGWGTGPAWDMLLFELPMQIYRFDGDDTLAKKAFPAMRKYLDYAFRRASKEGLYAYGLDDWCHPGGAPKTPNELSDTAIVYHFCQEYAFWCERFGKPDEAKTYRAKMQEIKAAFNKKYYKGNGVYGNNAITALAAPLYFKGLCADGEEAKVVSNLVATVRVDKHRCRFGIFGSKWAPRVLSDYGYTEDAWHLFVTKEHPCFQSMLKDYDCLWEDFGGNASRNHIMFGDGSAWAYEYIAGIKMLKPGFTEVAFKPFAPKGVDSFKATHKTPQGDIVASWKRQPDGSVKFDYSVPKGVKVVACPTQNQNY